MSGLAYYVKSNGIIQDPTSILKPPESDFEGGIVKSNTIKVKENIVGSIFASWNRLSSRSLPKRSQHVVGKNTHHH